MTTKGWGTGLLCAVALCCQAACGSDDVDLTGMYQVDTAVESEPCGADAPQAMPPGFLRFTPEELFGQPYFAMEECADAGGGSCTGGGLFGDSFGEPIDGGWRSIVTTSSGGSSSMCLITYTEATALLSGAALTVESSRHAELVENTEALCSTEEAERRSAAMPCERHEKLTATKL